MRGHKRNKRAFSYALLAGKLPLTDENGDYTGEYVLTYDRAVTPKANISPASGSATVELFGTVQDYDRVIIIDDMNCPINENSILWIDRAVEHPRPFAPVLPDDELNPDEALYPAGVSYAYENDNYVVKHVARGLYSIAYAVSKVADNA